MKAIINNRFHRVYPEIDRVINREVKAAAFACVARVKWEMDQPKTGRVYVRKLKTRTNTHTASAPGEAPARDTSTLYNSLRASWLEKWKWQCSAATDYAIELEYGKGRKLARPFMRPAAEHIRPQFLARIAEAVESVKI